MSHSHIHAWFNHDQKANPRRTKRQLTYPKIALCTVGSLGSSSWKYDVTTRVLRSSVCTKPTMLTGRPTLVPLETQHLANMVPRALFVRSHTNTHHIVQNFCSDQTLTWWHTGKKCSEKDHKQPKLPHLYLWPQPGIVWRISSGSHFGLSRSGTKFWLPTKDVPTRDSHTTDARVRKESGSQLQRLPFCKPQIKPEEPEWELNLSLATGMVIFTRCKGRLCDTFQTSELS